MRCRFHYDSEHRDRFFNSANELACKRLPCAHSDRSTAAAKSRLGDCGTVARQAQHPFTVSRRCHFLLPPYVFLSRANIPLLSSGPPPQESRVFLSEPCRTIRKDTKTPAIICHSPAWAGHAKHFACS